MNPEQAHLLRQAQESFRSARLLANRGRYDLAASRARDVMFGVAAAILAGQSLAFAQRAEIAAAFREQFEETGLVPAELSHCLAKAVEAPTPGDDLGLTLRDNALEQIDHAERFLNLSQRLIGPVPDEAELA